jgi:hypothetical protein
MAAKVNKTVRISLKDGSASKNVPTAGSVLGGGTRINTSGKIRGQAAAPATGPGFGAAKGIQK